MSLLIRNARLVATMDDADRRLEAASVLIEGGRIAALGPDASLVGRFAPAQRVIDGADLLVTSAEAGAAWTLLYPEFSVINPFKKNIRVPMYYLGAHDIEFEEFMEVWLELKKKEGVFDILYNYWILGKDEAIATPRWSIIRNVLHWVD